MTTPLRGFGSYLNGIAGKGPSAADPRHVCRYCGVPARNDQRRDELRGRVRPMRRMKKSMASAANMQRLKAKAVPHSASAKGRLRVFIPKKPVTKVAGSSNVVTTVRM